LRAQRIIRAEVFQALEDYERLKKIPKIYGRKRLNITIDENVLREFKAHSRKNGINGSLSARWSIRCGKISQSRPCSSCSDNILASGTSS
jgi:hypothetical protein